MQIPKQQLLIQEVAFYVPLISKILFQSVPKLSKTCSMNEISSGLNVTNYGTSNFQLINKMEGLSKLKRKFF